MSIFSCTKYATIKDIPDLESFANGQELYDYISEHAEWKPSTGTDYDGIYIPSEYNFIEAKDNNGKTVLFDVWYNEATQEFVALIVKE